MRTIPSDAYPAEATESAVAHFGWTSVGILHSRDAYGNAYAEGLVSAWQGTDVETTSVGFSSGASSVGAGADDGSIAAALDVLRRAGRRVIVLVCSDDDFVTLFPLATRLNMTGPDYAWIFSDSIEAETIEGFDDPDVVDGLVGAGKIFAAAYIPGDPVAEAIKDVYRSQNESFYNERLKMTGQLLEDGFFGFGISLDHAIFAFDAVGALGIAACDARATDGPGLLEALYDVDARGASGRILFDATTGSRDLRGSRFVIENVVYADASNSSATLVHVGHWLGMEGSQAEEVDKRRLGEVDESFRFEDVDDARRFRRDARRRLEADAWQFQRDFVFNGGSTTPPADSAEPPSCGAGRYLSQGECVACPRGTFQVIPTNVGGQETCLECDGTSYAAREGQATCDACGDNALVAGGKPGSTSRSSCVCKFGFYADSWPVDECRECPDDAHCAGGLTAPYPSPGFWMVPDPTRVKGEKLETYRCQLHDASSSRLGFGCW